MSGTTVHEMVERYGQDVYRAAYLYTGDSALAEDIAQEVFVAAALALNQIREPSRWLARVTHNKAINALRARGRRHEVPLGEDAVLPDNDPADHYDEREVVEAVRRLPLPLREVTILCYFDGFTPREVGMLLRIPAGTVRSRLHRARNVLRVILTGGDKAWEGRSTTF